jgi:N-acetylmuramoyl-L-alanine amidase
MGIRGSALAVVLCAAVSVTASAQSADQAALFKEAATRESTLRRELGAARPGAATATQRRVRTLVESFEDLARLFPASGQADKALWQGASLSADLFFKFGDELDRDRALRLLASLTKAFPGSSYARQAPPLEHRLQEARATSFPSTPASAAAATPAPVTATRGTSPRPSTTATPEAAVAPVRAQQPRRPTGASVPQPPREPGLVTLRAVRRELLPDAARVIIELDREVPYYSERIPGPDRVFVDLPRTRAVTELKSAVIAFPDDVVRRVRVGAQLGPATRVVLDLDGSGRHSVYTLYNPYRIVIDLERTKSDVARAPVLLPVNRPAARPALVPALPPAGSPALPTPLETPAPAPSTPATAAPVIAATRRTDAAPSTTPVVTPAAVAPAVATTADVTTTSPSGPAAPAPATPAVNARGGFSLSRQLGLGIARIVIDAGHGGHDPGAHVKGLSEAELTLDIALRLEKLLLRQPGVEVVLTRRANAYVALEERTEIANRSDADLFVSIHANASADRRARGVETYFLSLAQTADAEAVAARENAGSTRQMRQLPELLRAIALNDKVDESRDLAKMVQQALYAQARKSDKRARNLGVKQAPFVVLVGAAMPSILTEISFLTNQQDAGLLATEKYRQQLAEALLTGITRYQQSLKRAPAVATQ